LDAIGPVAVLNRQVHARVLLIEPALRFHHALGDAAPERALRDRIRDMSEEVVARRIADVEGEAGADRLEIDERLFPARDRRRRRDEQREQAGIMTSAGTLSASSRRW